MMRFTTTAKSSQHASENDTVSSKTQKQSTGSLFLDFPSLFLSSSNSNKDTSSASTTDKTEKTSSAFPDFLFMKSSVGPQALKKSKKEEAPPTTGKRNSFLSVLEKLMGSDNGKELIEKHTKVKTKKTNKNTKKTHNKRGHPKTVVARPDPVNDRQISDLSQPFCWQNHSATTTATQATSKRLSVSEQSITFNMDESKSDFFDWKGYSQSQIER